jgi:ribosomal protein L7/L12
MKYQILSLVREASVNQLSDIALRMAELHPETFEKILILTVGNDIGTYTINGVIVSLNTGQRKAIAAFFGKHLDEFTRDKIKAIKLTRELTGLGLKDAKDFVEQIVANW